jgi:hypothetical protein
MAKLNSKKRKKSYKEKSLVVFAEEKGAENESNFVTKIFAFKFSSNK